MSRQTGLAHWFWRLTHPRQARRLKAEELAHAQAEWERRYPIILLRQEQERKEYAEWLAIVSNPETNPDELARVVAAQGHAWREHSRIHSRILSDPPSDDGTNRDWGAFRSAVYAHPHLPPNLFAGEIPISLDTVSGLLSNPVHPRLIEHPDFLATLSERDLLMFCGYALREPHLPSSLIQVLHRHCDPWTALEASTHVSAIPTEEQGTKPDLAWFDRQVIAILRQETIYRRSLLYELGWHGIVSSEIQPLNPWEESAFRKQRSVVSPTEVAECVRHAQAVTKQGRQGQEEWRERWVWSKTTVLGDDKDSQTTAFFQEVFEHPDTPRFVRQYLHNWREFPSRCNLWAERSGESIWRRWCIAISRRRALREALDYRKEVYSCPGTFYLVLRDLPVDRTGTKRTALEQANAITGNFISVSGDYQSPNHFLGRLAVALHLDDADPKQRELRETLVDDPNRYVRAAARKEIAWLERAV